MLDSERRGLLAELYLQLTELQSQIRRIKEDAFACGDDPYRRRDVNGGYLLTPLLAAQSNVLVAITNLKKG